MLSSGALILHFFVLVACDHPSLVSKDYTTDKEAVEPTAVGEIDVAFLEGAGRCQICQTVYAVLALLF